MKHTFQELINARLIARVGQGMVAERLGMQRQQYAALEKFGPTDLIPTDEFAKRVLDAIGAAAAA